MQHDGVGRVDRVEQRLEQRGGQGRGLLIGVGVGQVAREGVPGPVVSGRSELVERRAETLAELMRLKVCEKGRNGAPMVTLLPRPEATSEVKNRTSTKTTFSRMAAPSTDCAATAGDTTVRVRG